MSSTYAIGDVQGCDHALAMLLEQIDAHEAGTAQLVLVGDLVNRGPASLATLRRIRALGQRARVVLGNHDLHLLAAAHQVRKPHHLDTLDDILAAPERDALLDWLRQQPLALMCDGYLLVHAGLLPQWTAQQALALSGEVQAVLRGGQWIEFLHGMYGNQPDQWNDGLVGQDRLRCIVNAMTRLRFCDPHGKMEFQSKEGTGSAPAGYLPWFDVPGRRSADTPIVCGHWSTLGLLMRDDLVALDTGCVWGGKLTAMRLHDRHIIQVECPQYQQPG